MSAPLSSDEAIEKLLREPSLYRTPEALRELAQQVSVDSPGNVTVLYSGGVTDRVSSWQIVKAMEDAGEDVRLIDRTEANKFLSSRPFLSATATAHGISYQDLTERTPAARAAGDWLYHPTEGPWADASARFADATRGEVKVIASGASPDRVFGQTELPRILSNPEVTTIEGIPRETLVARQVTHGTQAAFDMIIANSHDNVGTIRTAVNAQGLPLRGERDQLQLDNREYFRDSAIEGRTPTFHEVSRPMGDLMGEPNAHALSGRQQLDELARAAISPERAGPFSPRRAGAAFGIAGLALEVYDGAESVRTAGRLRSEGNATAAESELIHFGARSVGGWAGAGIGMATGAVLGVETGPGLLVTGAIGGVAGVFVGDKIAEWNDNRGIYNQELGGKTWVYDPDNPALGWRREAPIDRSDDGIDNARRGDLRASPATENALNYQATSRSVELVLGGPPAQRDPFSLPAGTGDTPSSRPSNWERDPESGQWQREVYGPFVERGMTPHRTESADAARTAQLDQQAAQIVVENAANSPASIAARYEDTYIRNGWAAHGEMPQAVRNARTDVDTLVASDENRYQRRADGEWVSTGLIYNSTASGNLREELDATRDVLQARLPSPREILPVPPMDADARLRDTVAGAYRNAGVDASAEQIAVAATAVRATWDANGLDPATTALQVKPRADGRYGPDSPIASLRLDSDGKTYVIAAETTPAKLERTRMDIAPHDGRQEREMGGRADSTAMTGSSTPVPARFSDPRDSDNPDHRLYRQIERGVASIDAERGRTFDATSERLTMGAFHDAKAAGITSAGHILINETGKRQQDGSQIAAGTQLFVVQGQDPSDPAARRSVTDVAQAVERPVEQSLQRVDSLAQQQAQVLAQQQNQPTQDEPARSQRMG